MKELLGSEGGTGGKYLEIEQAQNWFEEHLPELLKTHAGEYIVVIDGEIVVHGLDLGIVAQNAYTAHKRRPIFIEKVEPPHIIVVPTVFINKP